MAQTAKASQTLLRPPPKVLEKALKDSADRARRMAEAFGLKVPGLRPSLRKPVAALQRRVVRRRRNAGELARYAFNSCLRTFYLV